MSTPQRERGRPRWRTGTAATAAVLAALLGFGALPAYAMETEPTPTDTPASSEAPDESQNTDDESDEKTASTGEVEGPGATKDADESEPKASPNESKTTPRAAQAAAGDQTTWDAKITIESGTPDAPDNTWPADDEPGNDSGPDNDIIRTNDVITYRIQTAPRGGAAVHQTLVLTLPKGTYASQTPPFCVAGGNTSLTPAAADYPDPEVPTLADSWTRLPVQTLSCELPADLSVENSLAEFPFEVRVRPEVPNGTPLKLAATVTSDDVPGGLDITDAPGNNELTVSAAAKYDLSKNAYRSVENTQSTDSVNRPCPWDESISCSERRFFLDIAVAGGNKGISPASSFTLTDDLSPEAFFKIDPATNEGWQAALAAGEDPYEKYGARVWGQGVSGDTSVGRLPVTPGNQGGAPLGSGGTDPDRSDMAVRNSGTAKFPAEQSIDGKTLSAPGQPVTFSIEDADGTAWTYPTKAGTGASLNTQNAPVVSYKFSIVFPRDAIKDLGLSNSSGDAWTLPIHNEYQNFEATDILGSGNDPEANPGWNDYREFTTTARLQGSGFTKGFAGVPGTPGNTPARDFQTGNSAMEGSPGGSTWLAGDGQIYAGQDVISLITTSNQNLRSDTDTPNTQMVCDYWDPSMLQLHARDYPAGGGGAQKVGSNGEAVWMSASTGYGNSGPPIVNGPDPTDENWRGFEVKYTSVATPGAGWDCSATSESDWHDSPADVPGNDPAKAAEGIYTAVTGVRLWMQTPSKTSAGVNRTAVSIGLRMVDDVMYPDGTNIPNWATGRGDIIDQDAETFFAADRPWVLSQYDPETHVDAGRGDRVILASIRSTLLKDMLDPQSGQYTDNITQVTEGGEYTFRLRPSLGAGAGQATTPKLIVEDCLPAALVFQSASVAPVMVSETVPADAQLQCGAGQTYVKWDLGEQNTADPIDPITYVVQVSPTAEATTHTNLAQVSAIGDPSAASQRQADQQVRVINPAGLKITKRALPPVLELNRDADQPNNHSMEWLVGISNIGPVDGMSDADLIDVLPADGNDSVPDMTGDRTSHFVGSAIEITGASWETGGTDVKVLYTTADPASVNVDPLDASNQTGGSTTWTEWTDLSTAPAGITAIRMQKAGEFTPANNFALRLTGMSKGSRAGDVYINGAKGTARSAITGQWTLLGPISAQTTIIGGSIGDTFWLDANGNGVQDDGEEGVPNATVTLSGTDALGNPILLSTMTDGAGKYAFENLHSSDAAGYTVTFEIPADLAAEGYEFTGTEVGDDRAVDSNADGDGVAAPVALAAGASDLSIDAGISKPEIELVKSADPASGLDAGDVVTYTFTTTNTGQTTLTDVKLAEDAFTNANGDELTLDAPPTIDADASTGTVDALAPGEKVVWTATYTLTSDDLGGPIENDASTSGTSPRENTVEDDDDELVTPKGVGAFTYSKTSDPEPGSQVRPGDTVNYTVTVTHNGEGKVDGASVADDLSEVLDDADYQDDVEASAGMATIENGALNWTGDLADGQVVTITYSVLVKSGGDEELRNVVTSDDERGQCDDAVGCETEHEMVPGAFTFSKASDPESGATVKVGDTVKYTVTVKHDGAGAVTDATLTDDLSKVLDDADYQDDVQASAGNATVDGDTLTWVGDLQDGAEVTITYSVKVKHGGDEILHNQVTTTDERGMCEEAIGCDTTHTMGPGMFVYSKTSDPKTGSTVNVGDTVTYTLTVEHRGDGTVKGATVTDDLSKVLDDADYQGDIKASSGTATVTGDQLAWTGDVKPGEVITITYSVKVKTGGDRELANAVTTTDDRGACDTDTGCATTHDVPKPGTTPPDLPTTGQDIATMSLVALAALIMVGGGVLLVGSRRRKNTTV